MEPTADFRWNPTPLLDNIEAERNKTGHYIHLNQHFIFGSKEHLEWFAAYLALGFQQQELSEQDPLCALHALEISLRPIYELHSKIPPDFSRLHTITCSEQYKKLTDEHYCNIREDHQSYAEDAFQGYSDVANDRNLDFQAINLILWILRQQDGLRVAFGVVTKANANTQSNDHYNLRVSDQAASEYDKNEDKGCDGIAWFFNDRAGSPVEHSKDDESGPLSQWSGFAPNWTMQPFSSLESVETCRKPVIQHKNDNGCISPTGIFCKCDAQVLNLFRAAQTKNKKQVSLSNDMVSSRTGTSVLKRLAESSEELSEDHSVTIGKRRKLNPNLSEADASQANNMKQVFVRRRLIRGAERVQQPRAQPSPTLYDRRSSYEMEGVEEQDGWNASNQEEQKSLHYLYHDVEGQVPEGHEPLTEPDTNNIPYGPGSFFTEMERGVYLSQKPICNAPPWWKDLPWDDMADITFEEFIVYFPNHVARWPVLAVFLRYQSWDRLFYRTARIINLARGSHYASSREQQHTEVLPLMLKVQRAIQQIQETYTLANHAEYAHAITQEWFEKDDCIKRKPKNFPRDANVVTIEEAAGYITGTNEFQDRPFSKRVQHLQPNTRFGVPKRSRKAPAAPTKFPFANAFRNSRSTVPSQQQERGQQNNLQSLPRTTGWINTPMPVRGDGFLTKENKDWPRKPIADHSSSLYETPSAFSSGDDSDGIDRARLYIRDTAPTPPQQLFNVQDSQGKVEDTTMASRYKQSCKEESNCSISHNSEDGLEDTQAKHLVEQSVHDHGQQGQQHQNDSRNKEQTDHQQQSNGRSLPRSHCRHGVNCNNSNCPFGHRSPAAPDNIEVNLSQSCKFGTNCKNAGCNRTHPSPAAVQNSGRENKQLNGRKNHGNGGRQSDQHEGRGGQNAHQNYNGQQNGTRPYKNDNSGGRIKHGQQQQSGRRGNRPNNEQRRNGSGHSDESSSSNKGSTQQNQDQNRSPNPNGGNRDGRRSGYRGRGGHKGRGN